ncbi:bifunctional riboflavin kinase/FAD synthetase [Chitinophagaceae bacterium 26-R-25]|nr:bifunctional riboflavin kinase/FAD synthetase [Chitinophagaceae bacterium 26-R-25]
MQVHTNIESLPSFRNAVVTIGTFDGVHIGHQKILNQLKQEAKLVDGETVVITFHPHPKKVVTTNADPVYLLNTPEEKIALLEKQGIHHVVIIPFTEAFASQTATEYIEHFLWQRFNPHTLIIGYDHKFGKNRSGDYHLLEKYAPELGFCLIEIPEHLLNEVTVSSTRIRHDLKAGKITEANSLLGYTYSFEGKVIEGNKLGRTIGFPTANLQILNDEKLIPGNGVYAVSVVIEHSTIHAYHGMMNIGVRPTIDGVNRVIEVNIFDFNEDIYGQTLRVSVHQFLRHEQKFAGLDALKGQLAEDKKNAEIQLGIKN